MNQKNLLLVLALIVSIGVQAKKINTLSKKKTKQGWELLFNGEDLEGWTKMNGKEVEGWKVIDGILYNSGIGSDHGGDIITKQKYENFELYVEWKIDPKSNSGIFYRVDPSKSQVIFQTAPEYQLLDDKGWPTKLKESQYTGANYAMHMPKKSKVKAIDKWNKTRIVVKNNKVEHFLNRRMVVEYEFFSQDWKERKNKGKWKNSPHYGMTESGHIGLQDHGGLTQFRNIKIRKL